MLDQTIQPAQIWLNVQQPHISSYVPNSYLLLRSALDNGWFIGNMELLPSWDQHGLIYLVTLHLYTVDHSQQIILPKTSLVDKFLADHTLEISSHPTRN